MPGGKTLLAVLAVFGQLSLYVPKRMEVTHPPESASASNVDTAAEAQEFIAAALPTEVQVTVANDTVVITDTSYPEAQNYTEFVFPGEPVPADFSVQMKWAGRTYERSANAVNGELALMEDSVQRDVAAQLAPLEHLGITPNAMITDVLIVSHGTASPEGTTTGNRQAAEQRAQLGYDATAEAYVQHGIAAEKIHGEAIGGGAEGTLDEFVHALEPLGLTMSPEQALQLLKRIHDGTETNAALGQTFEDHVAVHRRADISVVVQLADVIVRLPAVPGAVTPHTITGLEYYAPPDRRRRKRKTGTPEYIPPLRGNPQAAFERFAKAITTTDTTPTPTEVFDTIVHVYTGTEQDPIARRAFDQYIATDGTTDITAIAQLADIVARLEPPAGEEFTATAVQTTFDQFARAVTPSGETRTSQEVFDTIVHVYTGQEQNPTLRQIYDQTIAKNPNVAAVIIKIAEVVKGLTATTEADNEPSTEIKNGTVTTTTSDPIAANNPVTSQPEGIATGSSGSETATSTTTGTGTSVNPPPQPLPPRPLPPPPPRQPPPPYAAIRPIYLALHSPRPANPHVPKKQYATGLGPSKGEAIGRAPARQSFKRAARKHHTGKR
jgi:hypothetical protein